MAESLRFHRKTIRLPGYDYTTSGAYFITLVTHAGSPLFGEISIDQVHLNNFGMVVEEEWLRTPEVRPKITLDDFVIMPDHLHGIAIFTEPSVGAKDTPPCVGTLVTPSSVGAHGRAPLPDPTLHRQPKSLGSFVAGFKSIVTKRINILRSTPGMPVWQRNYYEHIIRDDQDLNRIRAYIRNNLLQWIYEHDHPSP